MSSFRGGHYPFCVGVRPLCGQIRDLRNLRTCPLTLLPGVGLGGWRFSLEKQIGIIRYARVVSRFSGLLGAGQMVRLAL